MYCYIVLRGNLYFISSEFVNVLPLRAYFVDVFCRGPIFRKCYLTNSTELSARTSRPSYRVTSAPRASPIASSGPRGPTHTTPQLSPSRQSILDRGKQTRRRGGRLLRRHEGAHSPGSKASSAKATSTGAMAATRGHTTPAHAALARRRAHAAWDCSAAGPSGARRGTRRDRPLPPRAPPRPAPPTPPLRSLQVREPRPGPCPLKNAVESLYVPKVITHSALSTMTFLHAHDLPKHPPSSLSKVVEPLWCLTASTGPGTK